MTAEGQGPWGTEGEHWTVPGAPREPSWGGGIQNKSCRTHYGQATKKMATNKETVFWAGRMKCQKVWIQKGQLC